jgi:hypothetical protein
MTCALFLFLWISGLHLTLLITLSFFIVFKPISVFLALSWLGFSLICHKELSQFVLVLTLPLLCLYSLESLKAQFFTHFSSLFTLHPYRISAHLILSTNDVQYADDTQLFIALYPTNFTTLISNLENCLSLLHSWFCLNGLALIHEKSDAILFGTHHRAHCYTDVTTVNVAGAIIPLADRVKLLGVTLSSNSTCSIFCGFAVDLS